MYVFDDKWIKIANISTSMYPMARRISIYTEDNAIV